MAVEIVSWYFGALGIALTILFVGIVWYWMKYNNVEEGKMRTAAKFKLIGYLFLLMAAWFMCGVAGYPGAALRPDEANYDMAISIAYLVMLFLFVGFSFVFLGQRQAYKAKLK